MAKIRPATIAHFYEVFSPSKRIPSPCSRSRRSVYDTRTFSTSTHVSHFTYRLAASFNAKNTRFSPKCDYFSFEPAAQSRSSITPSTRRPNSGQDAFFISKVSSESGVAFAVADGVGGWSDLGIDSAHFSHGLCEHMEALARGAGRATTRTVGPRELLEHAYDEVLADSSIVGGGSTACVATGGSDGVLEVANLGDSGFIQLRLNAVHYHSNPQTHAFNTPYQLSIIPPKVLARSRLYGGRRFNDLPHDASVTTHRMRHGDVLIFATDGVWDNLSPADILRIVSRQMTESKAWLNTEQGVTASDNLGSVTQPVNISESESRDLDLQSNLAIRITREAKMASMNMRRDGPFAKEVQRYYPGEDFHGGKVDDICVVVAIVVWT